MKNILINGLKSKTGGGKSILNNYLSLLRTSPGEDRYFVLTPSREEYTRYESDRVYLISFPYLLNNNLLFPLLYAVVLPWLLCRYSIHAIFNLGTVGIPTRVPQLYLYDWPYAIYPESIVWERMTFRERLMRKIKCYFVRRWMPRATVVAAQTDVSRGRLHKLYAPKRIEIVPNAVSLENLESGDTKDFLLPPGRNLLCLTYYYPHKNLEIFLPLAREIAARGLNYHIIVTLSAAQGKGAADFLRRIKEQGLERVIVNVGPVEMRHVPSLYRQCNGLLLPTLLESFSGTYVEAMFHGVPVFTSDLDFAHAVCGDCAWYFDPHDANAILATVERVFNSDDERKARIEKGTVRVKSMAGWPETFAKIQGLLTEISSP